MMKVHARLLAKPLRDLDALRLFLLRLRNADREDTIFEGGIDLVFLDSLGQRDRAEEATIFPLHADEVLLLLFLYRLAFPVDRELAILEIDHDIVLQDTWQIHADDVFIRP